ncbi:hypothetical protein, partial [Xanthomonas sacchari]|uniref:hypothetical protein n=1 Tax=Xanthomonas sacchari TaxID=56458 RepID=UPI0022545A18
MSEATQARPVPQGLRKVAPLLTVLLVLLVVWFGWSGVEQWRAEQAAATLEQARDAAVTQTRQA